MIELDPQIAAAFSNSMNISSKFATLLGTLLLILNLLVLLATKGRGVHILKPGSKRRRT